ncbi:radical SAM protein [bacterium]|nr:radical SAM protein [bacterium]
MSLLDAIRVAKAGHFIRFMDFYIKTYGRFRFGTVMQRIATALSRSVAGPLPYVLKIDLLQACNLKCTMCYADHNSAEMALEDFKTIIRPLRGLGCRVDLMGGEPFLHPHLIEMVDLARNQMKFREVNVYTNGTRVTADNAALIKRAGLTHAMVNISSHDERQHDQFTGVKGSWRSALEGIEHLRDAGIDTHPFIVLHRENINDYEKIVELARERLAVTPLFFQYVPKSSSDPLIPSIHDWDRIKKKILYDDERGRQHGETTARLISLCGKNCLGGYHSFSVKVNGDVAPCPFIDDIIIGNALAEGFWNVFLHRNRNELYREFISVPEGCNSCSYRSACSGGCRAGQDGDYSKKDPRCLGPWCEKLDHDKLFEKIPTFF